MRKSPFTGYGAYRNGDQQRSRRPVYVPGKSQRVPISAAKREHVIDQVTAILKDWTFSPFEYEASVRHGLRQALCVEGNDWQPADDVAAAIVAEGLRNIGAKRPSWLEGQWHYTTPRENCAWCSREIEDGTSGQRFCSAECARAAIEKRVYETRWQDDAFGQSAYRLIRKHEYPERPCKTCGTLFRSHRAAAAYCSPKCSRAAAGNIREDRECACCGKPFHPTNRDQRHCSHSCEMKSRIKEVAARLDPCDCANCGTTFQPAVPHARYCSDPCKAAGQAASKRAYKERQKLLARRITPEKFDAMLLAA